MAQVRTATDAPPLPAELGQLFAEHAPSVFRALVHFGLPHAAAEDATQDVFLIAARRLSDFDRSRPARPWLWGIARRVARDVRRGRRRYETRLAVVESPEAPVDLEDAVAASEARVFLDAFLASLPEKKRHVFFLSQVEGASASEVAAALNIPENTVYSRLRSARQAFDRALARREAARTKPRSS